MVSAPKQNPPPRLSVITPSVDCCAFKGQLLFQAITMNPKNNKVHFVALHAPGIDICDFVSIWRKPSPFGRYIFNRFHPDSLGFIRLVNH